MLRFLAGLSDFLRSRLNKWNSCIQYAICTFSPIIIHIMHLKLFLLHRCTTLNSSPEHRQPHPALSWTASCTNTITTKQHPTQLWTTFWTTDCTTLRRNLHHLEPNQASPSYTIYCTTYWTSLNHIMHALYHGSLPAPLCRFFVQRYSATLKASGGHKSITFLVNRWFS